MGSSPVTATIERVLRAAGVRTGDLLLVAFSGGPDSTALLLALREVAPRLGARVVAAHVDHGMDVGSAGRARRAAAIARDLGVELRVLRGDAPALAPTRPTARPSPEARARELRYALLADLRRELGARHLLTGHHAGDQAETTLLRLLHGSGIAGLGAMRERSATLLRPLLTVPRAELAALVGASRIAPVHDPTNDDLAVPRNLLRHALLPALGPRAAAAARCVAGAADRVRDGVDGRLWRIFPELATTDTPGLRLDGLRALPANLVPWALALLHRASGLGYPPRRSAVAELQRRLAHGAEAFLCDVGGGARWSAAGGVLRVAGRPSVPPTPFSYTVAVPGRVDIRETATTFRLTRQPVAAWMWQGSRRRAALTLPLDAGADTSRSRAATVTVRNRRAGDRLQPFGSTHHRRLKDLLIDRKVPRSERDRLPLLCVGGQVAWVPGVTIHEPFRLPEGATSAWVAELLPRSPLTSSLPLGEGR